MRISKLALGFLLLAPIQLSFAQTPLAQLSHPVGDLEMTISANGLITTGVPNLQVVFRNLSDRELTVLLGIIGGSSPRPCHLDGRNIPCTLNFKLNVTDSSGATRTYDFRGIMYVAGRIDPYVAHLRARATFTLELGLDQFWSPVTREYEALSLASGAYKLSLEFEGRAPSHVNPELDKVTLWKGKLTSNLLPISVAGEAPSNKSLNRSHGQRVSHHHWSGAVAR